jgi:hypothetical protein
MWIWFVIYVVVALVTASLIGLRNKDGTGRDLPTMTFAITLWPVFYIIVLAIMVLNLEKENGEETK